MKKLSLTAFLLLCLILCACSPKPNMEALLSYQQAGTEMKLRITDTEIFLADLKITEENVTLTFTDEKREGISYRMDRSGALFMFYEDVEIPIDPSDDVKCKAWLALFSISSGESIWKIRRETVGGIAVFVCRDGRITIYIDEASGFPLRIESDDVQIDILSAGKS